MDINKTIISLEDKGYEVSLFKSMEDASKYLNDAINDTTVGIGGSVTIDKMGLYDMLAAHNEVHWHWKIAENETIEGARRKAAKAAVYLTSVNALSEDGEIINIDGYGNRLSSTLYGPEKVYFITGTNKIAKNLQAAIDRARNIASPLNAARLNKQTPCAVKQDKCYDCNSTERICSAMVIHFTKMGSCQMEVVLIEEELGY